LDTTTEKGTAVWPSKMRLVCVAVAVIDDVDVAVDEDVAVAELELVDVAVELAVGAAEVELAADADALPEGAAEYEPVGVAAALAVEKAVTVGTAEKSRV
jgi:hypothetical protein